MLRHGGHVARAIAALELLRHRHALEVHLVTLAAAKQAERDDQRHFQHTRHLPRRSRYLGFRAEEIDRDGAVARSQPISKRRDDAIGVERLFHRECQRWARLAGGIAVLTVLGYTYGMGALVGRASLMNFFGFFTNSTNLLAALIFIVAGATTVLGYPAKAGLADLRAIAATCLIVVGVGYNALPGVGTAPGWVSVLLHGIVPVAVTLDWVLVGDRRPVAWVKLWLVLPYPLLWLAMIQYRWATDQWVPYWYMHP